jgi:hypothetical protein
MLTIVKVKIAEMAKHCTSNKMFGVGTFDASGMYGDDVRDGKRSTDDHIVYIQQIVQALQEDVSDRGYRKRHITMDVVERIR